MSETHRFPYRWKLADGFPARGVPAHGATVFGTFICGGGSSMGYKLAGYDHLGGVEIDPKVAATYRANLHPLYLYVEDLRVFNARTDLPDELYRLDLLDGSPPCTTFSMSGDREKAWGREKRFSEGQARQTLDDLVFVYCDTIAKLRPRVCLLENVAGLLRGNAKSYARRIVSRLESVGYRVQVFDLFAARMGVPQLRERVFFIGLRRDLADVLPPLALRFGEPTIPFGEIRDREDMTPNLGSRTEAVVRAASPGDRKLSDTRERLDGMSVGFNSIYVRDGNVLPTLSTGECLIIPDVPRYVNSAERVRASSFPQDYAFASRAQLAFMTGMCVPPVMTANIAYEIYLQWLSKPEGGAV